jgi:hypothetical protein
LSEAEEVEQVELILAVAVAELYLISKILVLLLDFYTKVLLA